MASRFHRSRSTAPSSADKATTDTSTSTASAEVSAELSNQAEVEAMEPATEEPGFLETMGAYEGQGMSSVSRPGGGGVGGPPVDPRSGLDGGSAEQVAKSGTSGAGNALPHFDKVQAAFGDYDISGIRAHVDGLANTALGANAYAYGSDVVFGSTPSVETAAEEATHALVQGAGKGPGGLGQEGDAFERHADQVASKVARGESAVDVLDQMTGGDRSVTPGRVAGIQREEAPVAAPAPEAAAEEAQTDAPSTIRLETVAGAVDIDVPQGSQPSATIRAQNVRSPVQGLSFDTVSVDVDQDFNVTGGSARANVQKGPVSGVSDLTLQGNRITGDVDVTADLGIGRATGKARMTEGGLQTDGEVSAENLVLSNGLSATSSAVTWSQEGDAISARGAVLGTVDNVGEFGIQLEYADNADGGQIDVDVAERAILGQAKVLESNVRGDYSQESIQLTGDVGFGVGEWASGHASDAVVDLTAKTVSGHAEATVTEVTRHGLTLHSGSVGVGLENNTFAGGEAAFDVTAGAFRGGLEEGRYDPSADTVDGTVVASLAGEAQDLGNITLRSASGRLGIVANQPTALENGSAEIGIKVGEDAETLTGRIDSLNYDVTNNTVSGTATARTSAPLDVAGGAASIALTEATTTVTANTVDTVSGSATVEAGGDSESRLLSLSGTGTFTPGTSTVNTASGEASLVQAPLNLAPGFDLVSASGTASVTENALDAAGVDAGWRSETFEGSVAGAFDAENTTVTGDVSATVHTAKSFGEVASIETGSGTLNVQENVPQAFAGNATGKIATDFSYQAQDVDVDVQEGNVSGNATVGLDEEKTVDVRGVGTLETLEARGEMADNEVQSVSGSVGGVLEPGGRPFLDFDLEGSFNAQSDTIEQATGSLSLPEGEERQLGGLTVDGFAATATVAQNSPSLDSANISFYNEVFEGDVQQASVDVEGQKVSGTATAALKEPQSFGNGALNIESASGTAEVVDNDLGSVTGSVRGSVQAGENEVQFTAEDVELDSENQSVSGTVTASTTGFLDLVPGRVKAQITEAEGEMQDNSLSRVGGDYDVRIGDGSRDVVKVGANGDFSVDDLEVIEASGDAELLGEVELFGGALALTELVAQGNIASNELETGQVALRAELREGLGERPNTPALGVQGTFSQDESGFDVAGTASVEQFDIIQQNDDGRHLSGSMQGTIDTSENTFSATGDADFAVNESFGGDLDVSMDQTFDPGISGTLEGQADLVEENELFSFEKTVVWAPIPPIFGASLDASLSMSVGELSVEPSFTLDQEWKPISSATDLPDFEVNVPATWGVQVQGALEPYLYGGIRNSIVRAAIGAKGGGSINADAAVQADVGFRGQGGEFSGDVDLGVDLSSSLDLSAGVFAELGILGWDVVDWERDDLVEYTLADLFSLQWSKKFTFGDSGPGEEDGGNATPQQLTSTNSQTQTSEATTEEPQRKAETATSNDVSAPGGPSISGAGPLEALGTDQSEDAAQGDEEMSALEAGMQALTALQGLYSEVGQAVETLANVPFGVFELIWDIYRDRYDFDAIKQHAQEVMESFDVLMEYVAPMISGWFQTFWNYIQNSGQALLNALFGNSEAFRTIINDGVTIQSCPPEMLIELLEGALWDDMWTSEADEAACITVMNVAASRGMIDQILTPERTREIFRELDHRGSAFKQIVLNHAPASVLRSEVERYTGHWRLSTGEEREALSWIRAAAQRGILRSVLTNDAAEDIYSGMDGSRRTEMREILRSAGYDV